MGQAEDDMQNRTVRTGLPVNVCQERTANTGLPGEDCQERTARTGQPRQDCQDRTASTGLPELDCQNRTARRGLPEEECQEMTTGTEQYERFLLYLSFHFKHSQNLKDFLFFGPIFLHQTLPSSQIDPW
jgi:hypothetical protein